MRQIEGAALRLQERLEAETPEGLPAPVRHVFTSIGDQPYRASQGPPNGQTVSFSASHLGEMILELAPSEDRSISSAEVVRRWREETGSIPDVVELTFTSSIFSAGEAINVQLTGLDMNELQAVSNELKSELEKYTGVSDITDSFRTGKQEVKLYVKPAAEAFGITLLDLARQVRQAFYGEEAQRIQRGRDDVRIMVRYPESQRRSLGDGHYRTKRCPETIDIASC